MAAKPAFRRLFVLFLLLCYTHVDATETLRLATGVGPPFTTSRQDGFLDRLMAEAFRRAGTIATVQVHESSERALINANNGTDDGVVPRIKETRIYSPSFYRKRAHLVMTMR